MNVTIASLGLSPGKSMRSMENIDSLHFESNGMFGDREYMWVEAKEHQNVLYHPGQIAKVGHFLSQREDPILTSMVPRLDYCGLSLESDLADYIYVPRVKESELNQIPVSVWGWQGYGVDQGDEAAEWGNKIIGRPVRLVSTSDELPRYVENNPELGRVGFADGYPLLVTSLGSIALLNEQLKEKGRPEVPVNRFRANIILDGIEPFEEDLIDSINVSFNGLSLILERVKACGRCPIPDTDQLTGERKTHVRSALGKIGRKGVHQDNDKYGSSQEIFFGQNFIVKVDPNIDTSTWITLKKNQEILVNWSNSTNWRSDS